MKIWNTLSGKKEEFEPLKEDLVGMYNCGPTVYNFAHIGNLRAYIFADTLRRTLELEQFKVKQVINITDVGHLTGDTDSGEDKVEKEAKKEGKSAKEITDFYTESFFSDLDVKIEFPKATDHIEEQIKLIQNLEEKGFIYKTSDGIYFDTKKFGDYGKLGNINLAGLEEGARVEANTEKKNSTDFALWKFSKPEERRQQEWDSPWGVGFPGWHIECSAMSMKYLGETFDIHTGGIDHIPVHHNNEIAQSEAATNKPLARYWMHSAFINISGEKIAKSIGNTFTLADLKEKGIHPLSYRYWLLTAHYKTQVDFTFEAVLAAQNAFTNILSMLAEAQDSGSVQKDYISEFKSFIEDDLDTPKAIALLYKLIDDKNVSSQDKKATISTFDQVLGLNLINLSHKIKNIPEEIKKIALKRDQMRIEKKWKESDELRVEIENAGFIIRDEKEGSLIEKKLTPDM